MKDLKHYQQQAKQSRARKEHERICALAVERVCRPVLQDSNQRYNDLIDDLTRQRMRLHASILCREQEYPHLRKIATLQSFVNLIQRYANPIEFDLFNDPR